MTELEVKPEELPVIAQFRANLSDVLHQYDETYQSDLFLIRWLRGFNEINFYMEFSEARDMDLTKAEVMLRNSLKWREESNIDQILNVTFDDSFIKDYPYTIKGHDKDFRPLCYLPAGTWDMVKIVREDKVSTFVQYVNQYFEKVVKAIRNSPPNKKTQLPQTQFNVIVDFAQFSYGQLVSLTVIQTMLTIAQTYEAHYPEILYAAWFINCDRIFTLFFNFLKPILATRTLGKIKTFGTNREEWEADIANLIEPDQIKIVLDEEQDGTLQ